MEKSPVCPACGKSLVAGAPQGLCPECLMKSGFETKGPVGPGGQKTPFTPPSVEEMARLFPQLEILALLGHGGMGAVYKARQPALDRLVALKILPASSAEDPGFAERFNREARALARLNHPNIVALYDFGQVENMPYFLMEYVDGATLRQVVHGGKLHPQDTLRVVIQICEALQFAHEEGVVHRDIKPDNILVDQKGRIKITDFGIAKIIGQESKDLALTEPKDVIGTTHYMAPEQVENPQNVDHRADIYSLGVVFYELLTGELPLGKFVPPSEKSHSDARLDKVVLHTLEKEPERRYQQAVEVKTDVEGIAMSPSPKPATAMRRRGPPAGAVPLGPTGGWKAALWAGGVGLLALVALVLFAALFSAPRSKRASVTARLNDDQRLFVQWADRRFARFISTNSFDGLSRKERAELEKNAIETLQTPRAPGRAPRTDEFYQAISTLGTLHSAKGLLLIKSNAFEQVEKLLRAEISNRRRWLATRELGLMGDKSVVPELIHLLHHNYPYVRWWAQVSLVRLTGQNFGGDWDAWGKWWNSQKGKPAYSAELVRWWKGPPDPETVIAGLAEGDRKFIATLKAHAIDPGTALESEEN